MTEEKRKKELKGLGGWLIIIGIGLVISPFILLLSAVMEIYLIFIDGSLQILIDPSSEAYHPFWLPYLYIEFVGNICLAIAWFYLLYAFFSKRNTFPKSWIGIYIANIIFIIIDASLIKVVLPDEPIFNPETIRNIAQLSINLAIWGTYLVKSKRVKNTFIK